MAVELPILAAFSMPVNWQRLLLPQHPRRMRAGSFLNLWCLCRFLAGLFRLTSAFKGSTLFALQT
jgi:hypothetical protein